MYKILTKPKHFILLQLMQLVHEHFTFNYTHDVLFFMLNSSYRYNIFTF